MSEQIGTLLREARLERALTQRDLATLAGVPQPTISEIENGRRSPTFDLFNRIVAAGKLPLEVRLVTEPPRSATAAAKRLAARLGNPDHDGQWRDDAALRAIIDLRDALREATDEDLYPLVADRPVLCGERRWDAFLAGVVEEVCCDRGAAPPSWTQEPDRFVRPFWYLSTVAGLHEWELQTTPAALLRHGVLAAAYELTSA